MNEFKNKNVLVTGGTGLIGRAVVKLLCDEGAIVTSVSLDNIKPDMRCDYLQEDLRDYSTCLSLTHKSDYVFHIAGIKASPGITNTKPSTMSIPALMCNTNVLEACRENKVGKVLFTSSIGAYEQADLLKEENAYKGQPMDFLPGHVKRMAEYQIQGYEQEFNKCQFVCVRLANCYGTGDNFDPDNAMFIPSLMAKVRRGDNPVIVWGDGTAVRDFVYSEDVAKGILQIMLGVRDPLPVNLGSGNGYSVSHILHTLQMIVPFVYEYDLTKPQGVKIRVLDISKAKSFGYSPDTPLFEGLKKTWDWFNDNYNEYRQRKNYFKEDKCATKK